MLRRLEEVRKACLEGLGSVLKRLGSLEKCISKAGEARKCYRRFGRLGKRVRKVRGY